MEYSSSSEESGGWKKAGGKRKTNSSTKRHVWREEEVINLLEIAIKILGKNPKDTEAFYKACKEDGWRDLSNEQIRKKLSNLKSKYKARLENKNCGLFASEHEKVVYSLSAKLWGTSQQEPCGFRNCINCGDESEEIEDRLDIDLTAPLHLISTQIKDIKIADLESLLKRCLLTKHLAQSMIASYPHHP